MANEGLKLLVTADVTQAEKALKDFTQTAQTQGAKAGSSFGKGLNDTSGSLSNLPKVAKPAIKAIADIGDAASNSIVELKQLQKSLKLELSGLSKNQVGGVGGIALKKELEGVNSELKTLEKQAGIAGKATGGAFQKSYSVVKNLANLLPGIGIAGILGLVASGIFEIGQSLLSLDGKTTRLEDLKTSIEGAKDEFLKAATNVSTLKEQIRLAKEGFIDKDKVVKLYNDTIGRTTGFVTSLDQAERELNKNADNYIRFTLLKAAANVAAEKSSQKLFDAELERQKKLSDFRNGVVDARTSSGGAGGLGTGAFDPKEYDRETERIKAAQKKRQDDAIQSNLDAAKQFEDIQKSLNDQAKKFGFDFIPDDKLKQVKAKSRDLIAEAKKVADYFNDRSIRAVAVNFLPPLKENEAANKDIARKFLNRFQKDFRTALRESGFDFNVRPEMQFDTSGNEFRENVEKQGQQAINAAQKALDNLKKNSLQLNLDLFLKTNQARGKEFAEALGIKDVNSLLTDAQRESIGLAKTVSGVLTPAFQDLFSAIAAGESPLKAFLNAIGQSVLQLIQKLIAAAIQAAILSALVPGAAGAGGFAKIFKGLVGFASGGIVSGPTLALVGEGKGTSRSNPEVIAPLDQLRGLIQGMGGSTGRVQFAPVRIRGNDLLLSQSRTSRRNGRLGS